MLRRHDLHEDLHDGGRDTPRDGQRNEPGEDDVAEDGPVHILPRPEPAHEHDGTHLTVRGADRQSNVGRYEHGQGRSDLDTEAAAKSSATRSCE